MKFHIKIPISTCFFYDKKIYSQNISIMQTTTSISRLDHHTHIIWGRLREYASTINYGAYIFPRQQQPTALLRQHSRSITYDNLWRWKSTFTDIFINQHIQCFNLEKWKFRYKKVEVDFWLSKRPINPSNQSYNSINSQKLAASPPFLLDPAPL